MVSELFDERGLFCGDHRGTLLEGLGPQSERQARKQGAPTYVYYVNWLSPADGGEGKAPPTIDLPLGFDHISESRYTAAPGGRATADGRDERGAAGVRPHRQPQRRRAPSWPRFELARRPTMLFDLPRSGGG